MLAREDRLSNGIDRCGRRLSFASLDRPTIAHKEKPRILAASGRLRFLKLGNDGLATKGRADIQ